MGVFFFYIVIAASIPVNVLLQPRDYLNAWLLITGLVIGGISLIIGFDTIKIPAYTSWSVPIIAGKDTPFWPVVPLIIACGSLSGFHSMVSSGTTAKQLESEKQGLFIGCGAMFTEGFLSTIVIVSIGVFVFSIMEPELAETLKSSPASFAEGYGKALKSAGGPVGVFSRSYAMASHEALRLPLEFMAILASMWVSSFAMTTLDTTNRIARYAFTEILEPIKEKAPQIFNILTYRWVASAIPAGIGIALAWSGAWSTIWPAFGGANQMLASIALITGAVWVVKVLGNTRGLNVLIPALFLWLTVTVALVWYMFVAIPTFMDSNPLQAVILGIIMAVMILLNFLLIIDFFLIWREKEPVKA
jgi:carbon starvation protein